MKPSSQVIYFPHTTNFRFVFKICTNGRKMVNPCGYEKKNKLEL